MGESKDEGGAARERAADGGTRGRAGDDHRGNHRGKRSRTEREVEGGVGVGERERGVVLVLLSDGWVDGWVCGGYVGVLKRMREWEP